MDLTTTCHKGLVAMSLSLSKDQEAQLLSYLHLLCQWNKTYNLTAIRHIDDMLVKHVFDSLSLLPHVNGKSLLDVGSGAGLPGIPLGIANPDLSVVLLDSSSKKTRFLTQAIYDLKLNNVKVVNTRLEEFAPKDCFDTIVSRAFSTIDVMLNHVGHLLNDKGQILAMKGVYPAVELENIPAGFKLIAVHTLQVSGLDNERHVVCMEKEGS